MISCIKAWKIKPIDISALTGQKKEDCNALCTALFSVPALAESAKGTIIPDGNYNKGG